MFPENYHGHWLFFGLWVFLYLTAPNRCRPLKTSWSSWKESSNRRCMKTKQHYVISSLSVVCVCVLNYLSFSFVFSSLLFLFVCFSLDGFCVNYNPSTSHLANVFLIQKNLTTHSHFTYIEFVQFLSFLLLFLHA